MQSSAHMTGSRPPPTFPSKLTKTVASTWVRCLFEARHNIKANLHITADRFVRYLRAHDSRDSLVDLCICLESLIESHTEISFRFAMCLAKVGDVKNPEATSDLLSDLYDLRSRVVHGSDATREHTKVKSSGGELRRFARKILTIYILYMTDHTTKEWQKHLRSSLLTKDVQ